MQGLMQDRQLLISSLINYAQQYHADVVISTSVAQSQTHRTHYGQVTARAAQLANALAALGIKRGDRIGSLAWNNYRHLELYYAVPGMGAVLNTINPRLFPEQISFIINHAEDKYLFVDLDFLPLIEKIRPHISQVKGIILLCSRQQMPDIDWSKAFCYEDLIATEESRFDWPEFDEKTAASLCYTSGTTGDPKGVLYTHRSIVLHSMVTCMKGCLNMGADDAVMPIVPMFHVNAWGIPYAAAIAGSRLVFPGSDMSGKNIYNLLRGEGCTLALGVPTIWQALLNYAQTRPSIETSRLPVREFVIGGAAASRQLVESLENTFDAQVVHAWGMTETSPLGTLSRPNSKQRTLSAEELSLLKLMQGRPPFGIEMKIVDEDGADVPWDGNSCGHFKVRGPWVAESYFKKDRTPILDDNGFFATGDISTINAEGWMSIVDRSKDLIKSGGEWISSLALESVAAGHSQIKEAAVIGIPHSKWQERPLLICVAKPGVVPEKKDVLAYMEGKVAKWWLPNDLVFVDELPHNATGKINKLQLREIFKEYSFTGEQ